MKFQSLETNDLTFFELMTRQMRTAHSFNSDDYRDASGNVIKNYDTALKTLCENCSDEKAIGALDNAVGSYLSATGNVEYKNGFADAICMILQAAMHRN